MTTDAKVQIGNSADFLEGTSVTTPAGADLFREGVVISDPSLPGARAEVRQISTALTGTDYGLVTHSIIQGHSTAQGGQYVDVKVNPSGALAADVSGSIVALDAPTLAALESVSVQNTVTVQATDLDIRNLAVNQDSVHVYDSTDFEYSRFAGTVTAAGDTTLVTPAAGKRIRLQWVYALNDPAAISTTKITIKLGTDVQYVAWAISKKQQLTGPVNGALIINLSQIGDVAVTVFYQEVD